MNLLKRERASRLKLRSDEGERGFTLVETTIALVIMMIVMLGSASLFAFSIFNNTSGADRTQTLAVAQQTLETLRNEQFSSDVTDKDLLAGPPKPLSVTRGGLNGSGARPYTIVTTVVDTTPTLKTITVVVTPIGAGPAWATGPAASVTITTQRAKSD
jgi:type II secretory pathway pseudopilin PulG